MIFKYVYNYIQINLYLYNPNRDFLSNYIRWRWVDHGGICVVKLKKQGWSCKLEENNVVGATI